MHVRFFAPAAGLLISISACTIEPPPTVSTKPAVPLAQYGQPIGPEPYAFFASYSGEIKKNDTLSHALGRFDIGALEVDELVRALGGVFDVRNARVGHTFDVKTNEAGRIEWFRYVSGPASIALAFRGSDGVMRAMSEPVNVVTTTELVQGRIVDSLYLAMDQAGESPALTLAFVDLFAWDVDFFTETQVGDEFRILVEKRFIDGKLIGYGRVLGAEYAMSSGKSHRAFLYERPDAKPGYYAESGASVRKAFLKSPIQFASITSRYGLRRHPILKYVRAHRGIDYGAPIGTAVWAVGDGVVKQAGRSNGYGNLVVIQHANGLETRYAHLRGFGSGVSRGRRVSQKQVIGYVGMTGLTTGPHLHFEVLRQGRWTNPLTVQVPPAAPIADAERDTFLAAIAPVLKKIEEARAASAIAQAH